MFKLSLKFSIPSDDPMQGVEIAIEDIESAIRGDLELLKNLEKESEKKKEEKPRRGRYEPEPKAEWEPKTKLGIEVKAGKIKRVA